MNTQANIYTQDSIMYTKGNIMCIQNPIKYVQETTKVMINVYLKERNNYIRTF